MAAPMADGFEGWLSEKLVKINPDVDLEVFVSYITGILETETDPEERTESLTGILSEIAEENVEENCQEIATRWEDEFGDKSGKKNVTEEAATFEDKIHSIVEKQQLQKVQTKSVSAESKARKEAILAQYGHISSGEEDDDGGNGGGNAGKSDLAKNMNALSVSQREQDVREKMKQDSDQKKTKDREDREKQKQKALDRKDAEKKRTQKGERRR